MNKKFSKVFYKAMILSLLLSPVSAMWSSSGDSSSTDASSCTDHVKETVSGKQPKSFIDEMGALVDSTNDPSNNAKSSDPGDEEESSFISFWTTLDIDNIKTMDEAWPESVNVGSSVLEHDFY
jgi:hypothetical protein